MKMKERICQSYIRSAMLYRSETWCLRENEMAILGRTEKAMMRAMCKVKVIEKRTSQEFEFAEFKGYFGWTYQSESNTMVWTGFEKGKW